MSFIEKVNRKLNQEIHKHKFVLEDIKDLIKKYSDDNLTITKEHIQHKLNK